MHLARILALLALGTGPKNILIEGPRCSLEWIDYPATARILDVELTSLGQTVLMDKTTAAGTDAGISLAETSCGREDTTLSVSFRGSATATATTVFIDLAEVPASARPRTAALAILEQVRGLWSAGKPPVLVSRLPGTLRIVAAPEATPSALSIFVAGQGRVHSAYDAILAGARVGVRVSMSSRLSLTADASLSRGRVDLALGEISTQSAAAGVAALIGRNDEQFLGIGPRIELAYGWTSGQASRSAGTANDSGGALMVLACIHAVASSRLFDRYGWIAAIEAGGVVRGLEARANGTPVTGVSGLFASILIGVTISL